MENPDQPARRARSAFEDLRRAVMARLRELGFRTTGGVARLEVDGNCGVIEFQKSTASTAQSTTFTINVGIVLGELLPQTSRKPLSHCSDKECHARARIGHLREPRSDAWWTLAAGGADPAVAGDVLARVEQDAVPYVRRYAAGGALAALWESGESPGMTGAQRQRLLRQLNAVRGSGGSASSG